MNFQIGQVIHGFTVEKIQYVEELDANFVEMTHTHSGARLVYIDRDDMNKVFGIGFKTVPEDSTGVFHILEHCMLNGSEKYPLREPFVNLIKNSMQTFLNAMTYPDKTVYPVASRNEKDFMNLMSVYLDAVFAPNLRTNQNVFLQEGWHYELNEKESDPILKGVVFNEMKGATSSVYDTMFRHTMRVLYPDTCYSYNSGGEPSDIPNLTYEQFLSSYHKHYHADNSFIFLYGKMDLAEKLAFIDGEYLSKFTKSGSNITIQRQQPLVNLDAEVEYAIGAEEDTKDNYYCQLAWSIGDYDKREKQLALEIINSVLLATNESPLKRAILEAGLGKNVSGSIETELLQPMYSISLHKTNEGEGKRFYETVRATLEKIVAEGFDKKALEATINNMEFKLREMETGGFPQGVLYGLNTVASMIYGGDPALYIRYNDEIATFRREMNNGYFEKIVKDVLLDSNHVALLTVKPSKTLSAENAKKEAEKCKAYKASLTDAQVGELIEMNQKLRTFQETEDTPEQLATLPKLTLADLDKEPSITPTEVIEKDNRTLVYHKVLTGGIVYLNLYYNLSHVPTELLPYVAMKASMMGALATKKRSAEAVNTEVMLHMGDMGFSVASYGPDRFNSVPTLVASCSVIEGKVQKAIDMIKEVLEETVFDEAEVQKLLSQKTAQMQMRIMQAGNSMAMSMLNARLSANGVVSDLLTGVSYFRTLQKTDAKKLIEKLPSLTLGGLTVTVTGSEKAKDEVLSYLDQFDTNENALASVQPTLMTGNPAISIPAGVSYVAKGVSGYKGKYKTGTLRVMAQILRLDYLWNEVRAKGGAYGVSFSAGEDVAMFSSYRDPNVKNTLDAYDGCETYINQMNLSKDDLVGYIIGTVAGEERTLSPRMQGTKGDAMYFNQISEEKQKQTRMEILSATAEELKEISSLIALTKEANHVAAIGNEEKLKESSAFDEITPLS